MPPSKPGLYAVKSAERWQPADGLARAILSSMYGPFLVLGPDLRVKSASKSFLALFDSAPEEVEGEHLFSMQSSRWECDGLKKLLEDELPKHSAIEDYEFEIQMPMRFRVNAHRVEQVGHEPLIILALHALTAVNTENALVEERETLDALMRIGQSLASNLDLHALVQEATDAVTELTGAQFGAFFYNVVQPNQESYMLYTLSGVEREAFSKFPMPRNTAVFAPTFGGEGTVRLPDVTKDPRYGQNSPHKGMPEGHLPVRSYLAVPVKSRSGEVLGGMFFGHSEPGIFTERSERIAVTVASQAAIGIDNARLYSQATGNEEKFRTLASSIPHLVWTCLPDGKCDYLSPQWVDYTGIPAEPQLGYGWLNQVHPDDRAVTDTAWKMAVANNTNLDVEFRVRRADGVYRWFKTRAVPQRDAEGNISKWYGTNTDITDHREAEQRLRASELRFRQLADAMPHMVWVTRPDGFAEYYNKRWYEFTGVPESSTDGDAWNGVFHPEDQERAWARWRHSVSTGEPYEIEYRLRRADGEYCWVLGRAMPARDDAGNIVRWYGTCTDISGQLEREQFTRSILESSPDCIKVIDLEGHLQSMNEAGRKQMEIEDFGACMGKPWVGFWQGEHQRMAEQAFRQARSGLTSSFEGLCATANGKEKWWEVIVTPILTPDGVPKQLLSISRDISERKQTAQQLASAFEEAEKARDAAEEANIAKSEFLANMSHEIRTPMNAVIGISNILGMSRPLTREQENFIKTLQNSADSLLGLINDLLDISKIEARTIQLERIPVNLEQMLQEIISMMAVRVKEKGLSMLLDSARIQHRYFYGDPTRLRQILLNLCSNAVKFTEKGGVQITVDSSPAANPDIEVVTIRVQDSGIGIPENKQQHVFQKFVQADSSISRKYGGTGLGLAITKTLVDMMGGEIHVESQEGKGSCFVVSLPLHRAPEPAENASPASTEMPHETPQLARILLVEDYAPNVLVATTFLEQFGYDYDVAGNGIEAIEKIKCTHYAAVLMDVQMHGMNGFEATLLIRELEVQQGKPRTPIMGMTAHALAGDRERCLSVGMDDYISKPFDPDVLQRKLKTLCDVK